MGRRDVLVINLRGGVPPDLVAEARRSLRAFAALSSQGEWHTRVYSEHVHAAGVLDGLIGGGFSNILDRVHYPWSGLPRPERSVFHAFRAAGYRTYMRGGFGLERTWNPRDFPVQPPTLKDRLVSYGVDDFESTDSAFDATTAASCHDDAVFDKVEALLRTRRTIPVLVWANLHACADAHRHAYATDTSTCSVACWAAAPGAPPAFPEPPPEPACIPHAAAHAASRAFDAERGRTHGNAACVSSRARDICWDCLWRLDERLARVLSIQQKLAVVLLADSGFGLFEHGALGGELSPWDRCLRGFVAICPPRPGRRGVISDAPETVASVFATLTELCAIDVDRRIPALGSGSEGAASVQLALSTPRLARYIDVSEEDFCGFFVRGCVRAQGGTFSIIAWFALRHLGAPSELGATRNPTLGVPISELRRRGISVYVFDLEADPDEMKNLADQPGWDASTVCFEIKARFDDVQVNSRMDAFESLDAASFCKAPPAIGLAYEAHAACGARVAKYRDAATQTVSMASVALQRFGDAATCGELENLTRATVIVALGRSEQAPAFAGHWTPDELRRCNAITDLEGNPHPVRAHPRDVVSIGTFRVYLRTYVAVSGGQHAMYLSSSVPQAVG